VQSGPEAPALLGPAGENKSDAPGCNSQNHTNNGHSNPSVGPPPRRLQSRVVSRVTAHASLDLDREEQ